MNKGTAIVGFFLCFLAGMGLMWGIEHKQGAGIEAESSTTAALDHSQAKVPVTDKDPMWGNADAPVTIVEISDFQCPFCNRVNPTLKKIKETYGYLDKLVEYRHYQNVTNWTRMPGTTEDGIERQKLIATAIIEKKDRILAQELVKIWQRDLDPAKMIYKQERFDRSLLELANAGTPPSELGRLWPFPTDGQSRSHPGRCVPAETAPRGVCNEPPLGPGRGRPFGCVPD